MPAQVNPVSTAVLAITLDTLTAVVVMKVLRERTVKNSLRLVVTSIQILGLQISLTLKGNLERVT